MAKSPTEIRDELLSQILKDSSITAVVKSVNPPSAPMPLLEALAGNLKALIKNDLFCLTTTRQSFVNAFHTNSALHGLVGTAFDSAPDKETSYYDLRSLGMPPSGERLGYVSPGQFAKQEVYASLIPGGLAQNYGTLVAIIRTGLVTEGKVEFNVQDQCVAINRKPVEDYLTNGTLRVSIQENFQVFNEKTKKSVPLLFSDTDIQQAISHVALENTYHPAREWFEALPAHDGVDRSRFLAADILDALKPLEGTPEQRERITIVNELIITQAVKFRISVVARTYAPGCKVDTSLILFSKQGSQKSTFFKLIAPAGRFSDEPIDLKDKDSKLLLCQTTLYEWSELSVMRNAKDMGSVKGFLSQDTDQFRTPYGRVMKKQPRWCVIVGTTNEPLPRDPTGSRRFWVIQVDNAKIDIAKLLQFNEQMWAEAKALYMAAATCAACTTANHGRAVDVLSPAIQYRCDAHSWWLNPEQERQRAVINEEFVENPDEPEQNWFAKWRADNQALKQKQGAHGPVVDTNEVTVRQLLEAQGLQGRDLKDTRSNMQMSRVLKDAGYTKVIKTTGNVWRSPFLMRCWRDVEAGKFTHAHLAKLVPDPATGEPMMGLHVVSAPESPASQPSNETVKQEDAVTPNLKKDGTPQ